MGSWILDLSGVCEYRPKTGTTHQGHGDSHARKECHYDNHPHVFPRAVHLYCVYCVYPTIKQFTILPTPKCRSLTYISHWYIHNFLFILAHQYIITLFTQLTFQWTFFMNTMLARHDMAIRHDVIMHTFLHTLVATFILISILIIWSFHGHIIPVVINVFRLSLPKWWMGIFTMRFTIMSVYMYSWIFSYAIFSHI